MRVEFLDNLRYLMIVLVVVYHSVAAYANVVPWWAVHDAGFFAADVVRELLDVFMMPVLFFVAGYFTLPSLRKKGLWEFLRDKGRRLLIPWALAVLIVFPLLLYDQPNQTIKPFRDYWLWYLNSFPTKLEFLPRTLSQGPYWFISLLFAFFVLFALLYTPTRRWGGRIVFPVSRKGPQGNSALMSLLLFGVLTSAGYFVSLLLSPDTSWLTLSIFLQFQPTRLGLFASYFALGVYVQSRGWFARAKPWGRLAMWGAISAGLAVAYLVVGQPLYTTLAGASGLPVGLLLTFAFIRSFLVLSLLVVLVSVGVRYWNRSSGFDRQLSEASYNIYLTHVWFVVIFQEILLGWSGSVLAKFMIVLSVTLALSFVISRWVIGRYPRASAAVIVGLFVFCLAVRP
jgi:glucan biosynthesis protein C